MKFFRFIAILFTLFLLIGCDSSKQTSEQSTDSDNLLVMLPVQSSDNPNQKKIAAGHLHSLWVRRGNIYSFGDATKGQLGLGTTQSHNMPQKVDALLDYTIVAVAASGFYSLALDDMGNVYSFGEGFNGTLGHGDTTDLHLPKRIEALSDITAIAAGRRHALALDRSGNVYSFGQGYSGALGHGTRHNELTPKVIDNLPFIIAIATGEDHSLVLDEEGNLYSFGSTLYGQLGLGYVRENMLATPMLVEDVVNIVSFDAGKYYSLAVDQDGVVWGFGTNEHGQFGRDTSHRQYDSPEPIFRDYITTVSAGEGFSLTIDKEHHVFSFGNGINGVLGHGSEESHFTPKMISSLQDIVAIDAGNVHSLALDASGTIWCFGSGYKGQLGNRNNSNQTIPKKTSGKIGSRITDISAGFEHTLILDDEKNAYAFGNGDDGRLGIGDDYDRYIPTIIDSYILAVNAAKEHSVMLDESRYVWSFGSNHRGQLGQGSDNAILESRLVRDINDVTAIGTGDDHTFLTKNTLNTYAFGYNSSGQLGVGDTHRAYNTPKLIETLKDVTTVQIDGGRRHTLLLDDAGQVYSFGFGSFGALGHGDNNKQTSPKAIAGMDSIQAISAGGEYSLLLDKNGSVYSFGDGYYGQLGHGESGKSYQVNTPKRMMGFDNIIAISAGLNHAMILDDTGSVYSFGKGADGRLGHGDELNQSRPKHIDGIENIIAISAGGKHSVVLDNNGKIFGFGNSEYGQLGLGDEITTDQFIPVRINIDYTQ